MAKISSLGWDVFKEKPIVFTFHRLDCHSFENFLPGNHDSSNSSQNISILSSGMALTSDRLKLKGALPNIENNIQKMKVVNFRHKQLLHQSTNMHLLGLKECDE